MFALYFLLANLLALNVQGYYLPTVNEQSWLKEKLVLAIDGLKDYFVNVEIAKMNDLGMKARNELNFSPGNKCTHDAHQRLVIANYTSFKDFIHCTEVPEILWHSKKIISEVFGLVELYIHDLKQMLDGPDNCTPTFSENGLKCLNAYFWNVLDWGEDLAARTGDTMSTVKNLIDNIADEISICKRSVGNLINNIQAIMSDHYNCINSENSK